MTGETTVVYKSCCGVLTGEEIIRRVKTPISDPKHLDITPFDEDLVQDASLDVRLGNHLAVARKTRLTRIRIGDEGDQEVLRTVGMERFYVPHGKLFVIHPGSLVLGTTLEFIALPTDVMAYVEGRSSIGRLGLVVATATQVAPGFHGVIVLELANSGTVPLEVQPGLSVAQLVFHPTDASIQPYSGRYSCQIEP